MFMGRQFNNNNGVNVNTKLYTSYSDACMVTIGGWNTNLSVKFHPFKGVNADGVRQYAQDNSEVISTSLTVDNTTALLKGINDKINPAIEAKTEASVSVPMGNGENRKMLTVSTDGEKVSLSIAIHVDDNGIASAENVLTHSFNTKEYMTGYNPTNGSGETVTVNADYINFVKKLESIYDIAPVVPHAINYNNALKASFSNRQASNNQNTTGSATSSYDAPSTNYTGDMADFLPFN